MFVANRMTANPVCVNSNATVPDATELMRAHKFRRLPVVNAGQLVGIVTDRDLREVAPSPAISLSVFELKYLLDKMQVKDIMTREVISINVSATIEEAAFLMYKHRIGGLVVVNNVGTVVGVITETDIFKCFVDIMGLPGKTRLTIDVSDKVGVVHEVTAVFADMNINIGSMAVYCPDEGKCELVIRADVAETDELIKRLADKGYPVQHIVQIKHS